MTTIKASFTTQEAHLPFVVRGAYFSSLCSDRVLCNPGWPQTHYGTEALTLNWTLWPSVFMHRRMHKRDPACNSAALPMGLSELFYWTEPCKPVGIFYYFCLTTSANLSQDLAWSSALALSTATPVIYLSEAIKVKCRGGLCSHLLARIKS